MVASIVGGVIGAAIFAFILYTGWDRTVTRWRETEDPLLRAAQAVVAIISNLGLLLLLAAGIAAVASFVVYRADNPLLLTLAAIGVGLFIGSYVLGFVLALFIRGADTAAPSKAGRSYTKRKRKKKRKH